MRQPGEGIFGDFSMCLDNFWFPVIQRETHPEKKTARLETKQNRPKLEKHGLQEMVFFWGGQGVLTAASPLDPGKGCPNRLMPP